MPANHLTSFSQRFSRTLCKRNLRTTALNCSQGSRSVNVQNEGEGEGEGEDFGSYDIILPPEPYVWGVEHIVPRSVPSHIRKPNYAAIDGKEKTAAGEDRVGLGTEAEARLRAAARLARTVREFAGKLVKVGVTTNEIDAAVHEFTIAHGAYPSPLLYSNFPRSCCTSVNNIIAHGIPDDRPLQDGDIVNVDVTVYLDGYHGDTSQTFPVGDVDKQALELLHVTNASLGAGISACGPGRPFRGIAQAIHEQISHLPYSVSSQFTGHGIGTIFHRAPWIVHSLNEEPGVMLPGHCFTIEPCIIQGSNPRGWIFPDGWTTSTLNGARCAQAEHMVLITKTGADVLTS